MTFYAVTKGSYSDYHIITITTDKEKAEFLAKKFSDDRYEAKVEEYIENDILCKTLWFVEFDNDGNVRGTGVASDEECYKHVNEIQVVWSHGFQWSFSHKIGTVVLVTADDKESAIKIAAEKRAEFLAREEVIV